MAGSAPDTFPSILERREGYRRAMAAAGLEPLFVDGHHDEPSGVTARLISELDRVPDITGVIAANDEVAVTILGELAPLVPSRLSMIGFDDIDAASKVRPRLDTVAVDKQSMGRLAVAMLVHRVSYPDDPAFTAVQPVSLVVRDSAGPPPT